MYDDWFYTTHYGIFTSDLKSAKSSPPDDLGRWIITRLRGLTKKGIDNMSKSMRAYVNLMLTSQVQARSSAVGNSVYAVDAQQVFNSTFKALINENNSINNDIQRYQDVLEHALSKLDFSVGIGIYMLPRNLNVNIGKKKGFNNKILISKAGMKIGPNKEVNKLTPPETSKEGNVVHYVPMKRTNKPVKEDHTVTQHDNSRMFSQEYSDEKLAITLLILGADLLFYHFLREKKWQHYYSQLVVLM